jgi:hypothetical protein
MIRDEPKLWLGNMIPLLLGLGSRRLDLKFLVTLQAFKCYNW